MLLSTAVFACGGPEVTPPPPPEVEVATPERRLVTIFTEFTGTTRAVESVDVRARVSGVLERMDFRPSAVVQKDQLLFVIEPLPYRAAFDEAEASVKAAQAELDQAGSEFERISQAVKTKAVSESSVDLARAARDKAHAALLGAQAKHEQAELEYSYTEVRAPLTGQVSRNFVDVGNVVGESEATVLTTVNRIRPIHVYFDAPEESVLRLLQARSSGELQRDDEEQLNVFISTLVDEDYPHEGRIDYISNTVDAETGTIELRAALPNDDQLLFPGLFVRVRAPVGTVKDAVLVDEKAVGTDLGGRYVYVLGDENVVEQRYVQLGPVQEDGMVYVREGLDGSETYVSGGLLRARPGLPVTPKTEDPVSSAEPSSTDDEASSDDEPASGESTD
jgi:RND family efflux transporter MFP subunit